MNSHENQPDAKPRRGRRGRPPAVKDKKLLQAALKLWELKNSSPKGTG